MTQRNRWTHSARGPSWTVGSAELGSRARHVGSNTVPERGRRCRKRQHLRALARNPLRLDQLVVRSDDCLHTRPTRNTRPQHRLSPSTHPEMAHPTAGQPPRRLDHRSPTPVLLPRSQRTRRRHRGHRATPSRHRWRVQPPLRVYHRCSRRRTHQRLVTPKPTLVSRVHSLSTSAAHDESVESLNESPTMPFWVSHADLANAMISPCGADRHRRRPRGRFHTRRPRQRPQSRAKSPVRDRTLHREWLGHPLIVALLDIAGARTHPPAATVRHFFLTGPRSEMCGLVGAATGTA